MGGKIGKFFREKKGFLLGKNGKNEINLKNVGLVQAPPLIAMMISIDKNEHNKPMINSSKLML